MSQLDQIFTDIAESIIEKDQGEGMKPTEMAERISNLSSGGGIEELPTADTSFFLIRRATI